MRLPAFIIGPPGYGKSIFLRWFFGMRKIVDIQDMPNFNPSVKDGLTSVSEGKVSLRKYHGEWFPACQEHGALLKVSKGGIWRCMECHEGCYEVTK